MNIIHSRITSPNLSVNIDKDIATENFSEKSHGATAIDFSINNSFSTSNCSNFPINNGLNKTKLNDINK